MNVDGVIVFDLDGTLAASGSADADLTVPDVAAFAEAILRR